MFRLKLDPQITRQALLDALLCFVLLLLFSKFGMHQNVGIVPALAVAGGTFCLRYVMIRRMRDLRASK